MSPYLCGTQKRSNTSGVSKCSPHNLTVEVHFKLNFFNRRSRVMIYTLAGSMIPVEIMSTMASLAASKPMFKLSFSTT